MKRFLPLATPKPAHHVGPNGIDKIATYLENEGLLNPGEYVATIKKPSEATKPSQKSKTKNAAITFDGWQKTLWNMVNTVKSTTENSNGQVVERVLKNKELRIGEDEIKNYIEELRQAQNGCCAISGIKLHYLGEAEDNECVYSLDRIDSDGHYERGNLQLVCRFINRWKSDSSDVSFRKLLDLLRSAA